MDFKRGELDTDGVAFVNENQRFSNANSAFEFATERLASTVVATPSTTTTTTTTAPRTTTTNATPPTTTEP